MYTIFNSLKMSSFPQDKSTDPNPFAMDIRGLSTDDKPVGQEVKNGSTFLEMDTSKVFMYDADNEQWHEIS